MRGPLIALALLAATGAHAGSLVDVSVQVGGAPVALYPANDGSGRLYFEAHAGCDYTLRLVNRTHDRLGALLIVDGLNAISGEREEIGRRPPGRMYVLSPWDDVEVRGWRASLDEVRRFTFVDERSSYAARAGKANRHIGWVEVAVYRDRAAQVARDRREKDEYGGTASREAGAPAPAASADRAEEEKAARGDGSYPGTGWGSAAWDPATEVRFDATRDPVERTVLRYEYAPALRALGILPRPWPHRDRLGERDRGEGFAAPPLW